MKYYKEYYIERAKKLIMFYEINININCINKNVINDIKYLNYYVDLLQK